MGKWRIQNFLIPESMKNDKLFIWKSKIIVLISLSIFTLLTFYAYLTYIKTERTTGLEIAEFSIALMTLLGPFIHKYSKSYLSVVNYFILCAFTVTQSTMYFTGGFSSPLSIYHALIPVAASIYANKYSAYFWSIISGISIITWFNFSDIIIQGSNQINNPIFLNSLHLRSLLGVTLFSSLMGIVYKHFIDENIDSLGKQKINLQNLIKMVGHDIANPLSVIIAIISRYKKRELDPKLQKNICKAENAALVIKNIINQVQTMQSLESKKVTLELTAVNFYKCVQSCLDILEFKINEKKLIVQNLIDPKLLVIAEEKTLTTQVITNIISNAIKFSKESGTIILRSSSDDKQVKISIQDFGIGIPPTIVQHLFDMREKTSRRGTNGEKGTGFGMPLVKCFIDIYKGQILVESKTIEQYPESSGSTFHIYLRKYQEKQKQIA